MKGNFGSMQIVVVSLYISGDMIMTSVHVSLPANEEKWMTELHQAVSYETSPSREGYTPTHSRRALMVDEWDQVQLLIRQYSLPCRLYVTSYGFGMCIFAHPETVGVQPEALLGLYYSQISGIESGPDGQSKAIRKLGTFTHSAENQELLGRYGIPHEFDEPSMYVY